MKERRGETILVRVGKRRRITQLLLHVHSRSPASRVTVGGLGVMVAGPPHTRKEPTLTANSDGGFTCGEALEATGSGSGQWQ